MGKFDGDWERLSFESETLRLKMAGEPREQEDDQLYPEGKTREAIVRTRVNQGLFRAAVLAAYDSTCCITGISVNALLCASHLVPSSQDKKNKANPRNGLCLNAIHDRAFDRGLLTITLDYEVMISPRIRAMKGKGLETFIHKYDHARIKVPNRFAPGRSFLQFHQEHIFLQ